VNDTVLAVVLASVLAGLGGLLVPRLIARIPEPEPVPEDERVEGEPDKIPYVELAARPGLAWRSAVVAAVAGGLLGWGFGLDWPLLWLVPLTPVGAALAVIDWHTRLLPRGVVVFATLAAIVLVVSIGLATGERDAVVRAVLAMLVARSFFWVLWFLRSAGMGFGDVRLAAPVGLVLGWVGWEALLLGLWVGFLVFSMLMVGLMVARRDRTVLKRAYPFGPFMLVGALAGLVWGTALAGRIWG
jgi:leader peptidase (prepilin peptidase)/N-methyltransferase